MLLRSLEESAIQLLQHSENLFPKGNRISIPFLSLILSCKEKEKETLLPKGNQISVLSFFIIIIIINVKQQGKKEEDIY